MKLIGFDIAVDTVCVAIKKNCVWFNKESVKCTHYSTDLKGKICNPKECSINNFKIFHTLKVKRKEIEAETNNG